MLDAMSLKRYRNYISISKNCYKKLFFKIYLLAEIALRKPFCLQETVV